jgi:hypothetical protein
VACEVHRAVLSYRFGGKLDDISGTVNMGEYMGARWTAKRHAIARGAAGAAG